MRVSVPWSVPALVIAAVMAAAGTGDQSHAGENTVRRYELAVEGMT